MVQDTLSAIQSQERSVDTLISSGTLTLDAQDARSEASVFIVACREPSRIKIEVTHSWGQPLFHILVRGSELDILSFSEKRRYRGHLGNAAFLKLLPTPLSPGLIWTMARAYPVLALFHKATSLRSDQISLMDLQNNPIQTIDFYPDSRLPRRVCFCRQGVSMSFCDFQQINGMRYAREVRLMDDQGTPRVELEVREMVFNRTIPKVLFTQESPKDFEMFFLEGRGTVTH